MIEKIIITPFQKFVKIESLGGILLFAATIIALIWANSSFGHLYESLWQYKTGISSEGFELSKPLILWINDGLMAIFFFLIGLEIKRELLIGELNSLKKAAFPFYAAIGGILLPVSFFLLLNRIPETIDGWGIPMATDIAFTLAILQLLGNRVPLSLKVFLTAFAIIDDLGAVMVIAVFYSSYINWMLLIMAIGLLLLLFILSSYKIYSKYLVVVLGVVIWYLFLKSGIHPTIAGVLLAFVIPIRRKVDRLTFTEKICSIADKIRNSKNANNTLLSKEEIEHIDDLEDWMNKVQSPLQHLEHKLHNWVAFLIVPVFALSNAGVVFSNEMNLNVALALNIAIGLVAGKSIGITILSFLGVKLGLAELPEGINFKQIIGIAFLAGVGFTMSIYIANLAFDNNPVFLSSAKVGIFIGSIISGLIGYLILLFTGKR